MLKNPVLEIKDLRTSFNIKGEYHAAVDGVSLTVHENEVVAIVGESGCGKSALALSVMGLHDLKNTKLEGQVNFSGQNLLTLITFAFRQSERERHRDDLPRPDDSLEPTCDNRTTN